MAFEELEKALARESNKLSRDIFQPKVVNNLNDIMRLLSELDPKHSIPSKEVQLATLMNSTDDGKNNTYKVTAVTKSKNKREILIDGLDLVKRQINAADHISKSMSPTEVNGIMMLPPKFGRNGQVWVDPLIKQWLGGYRDGLDICWDIGPEQYRYNIYEHKLARVLK